MKTFGNSVSACVNNDLGFAKVMTNTHSVRRTVASDRAGDCEPFVQCSLRRQKKKFLGINYIANVYIEARPKDRADHQKIDDYVVEDYADHVLATFKTQKDAIDWAKQKGHTAFVPHVARVRRLNDKKIPDHWRAI